MKIRAICSDLDGTLCDHSGRLHFITGKRKDFNSYHLAASKDPPNQWCLEILKSMCKSGYYPIFLSGRPDRYREQTEAWLLDECGFAPGDYTLFLAAPEDRHDNAEYKKRVYFDHLLPDYNVLFVLEDWQPVVDMWRSIGVVCLQCDQQMVD